MASKNQIPTAFALFLALFALGLYAPAAHAFELISTAIDPNAPIPVEYTCSGADISPPLRWSGAPAGTKSFALIVEDPDAPSGVFYHWVAYNLPPSVAALPAHVAASRDLPTGGEQGLNSFGTIGYRGPCPPPGKPHHYHFRLFALDAMLHLQAGANAKELESAIDGHTLAAAELIGIFRHR